MDKEVALKHFLKSNRNDVIVDSAFLFLSLAFLVAAPFLYNYFRIWKLFLFISPDTLSLCLALVLVFFIFVCGTSLFQTLRAIREIKNGKFEIIEDTVVDKTIEKGFFSRNWYCIFFQKLDPERPDCKYHNLLFVSEKEFENFHIGEKKYFLRVKVNDSLFNCLLNISKQEELI